MGYTLITGATGGLGVAFATECAKRGEKLFLLGRTLGKMSALKARISKYKVPVESFLCDLSDENARKELINYLEQKNIEISKVLFVAGVDIQKPFVDYSEEKMKFQLRVNTESIISLTYALLKRRKGKMDILAVSSMSGVTPMPYFALYSATKAMLTNFFSALHVELKKDGIKVTTVMPGGVYTRPDIIEDIKRQGLWGKLTAKTPEFVAVRSLKALDKNKIKFIPGFFNKLLNVVIKITPKPIVLAFISRRWKKQTKDAF